VAGTVRAMMTAFDEMKEAFERSEKYIAEQNDEIHRLREALSSIRYHFNAAVTHLEKITEELRRI
jgi:septation ring formation regulator EzrA